MENYLQGRTKMIEDGIMDKWWREFKSNETNVEEVAFSQSKSNLNIIVFLLHYADEVVFTLLFYLAFVSTKDLNESFYLNSNK